MSILFFWIPACAGVTAALNCAVTHQGLAVFFQPIAAIIHIVRQAIAQAPERRRMVEMDQMCNFVRDDIVDDFTRSKDQAPAE